MTRRGFTGHPANRVGVPRSVARSITGHKTESMYLRYRAVRRDEQDEALAKIAVPTE